MKLVKHLSTLLAGTALAGCAVAQLSGGTSWQEEALLHDGSKIIVQRSQSYGGRSEPGQPSSVAEESVSFRLAPGAGSFTWTSEFSQDIGRSNFNPLAVHVLHGIPYVVASPNLCPSYNKWGRPNPPYVIFKYEDPQWRRIPIGELPAEFKTINLLVTPPMSGAKETGVPPLISAENVKQRNASFRVADQYRSILREPLLKEPCPIYPGSPKAPNPITSSSEKP